jgi:pilus assembly protein CpaF
MPFRIRAKDLREMSLSVQPQEIETVIVMLRCFLLGIFRTDVHFRPAQRGGEALDMLQAMNTGHDGSLTTVHANSPRDAISRLETLCLVSGVELPLRVVREQIASAVDLIVQQTRLRDGSRKVTAISEVIGMEGDIVVMSDLFGYKQTGIAENGNVNGELRATGIRPMFGGRLEAAGYHLKPEIFGADMSTLRRAGRRSR